jgi:hypothetical protein
MALNPPLNLPYIFVNGTIIDAVQVNADFALLADAMNIATRNTLIAPSTFYVAPFGVDVEGNGLSSTSPAKTIQFVIDLLRHNYDINQQTVTIQLANGTYLESVFHLGFMPGLQAAVELIIQGNMTTPSLVNWTGSPTSCLNAANGALVTIQGLTMSGPSNCIIAQAHARVLFNTVVFGTAGYAHIVAARGGLVEARGNYTIAGGAVAHIYAMEAGQYFDGNPGDYTALAWGNPTVTVTGTPAFGVAFVVANNVSSVRLGATFTGAATGPQWLTNLNGVVNAVGHKLNLPGSTPGTDNTGGQSS